MSDLLAVLAAFQHDPLSPGALGELVLPFRRQFQLYPDQKYLHLPASVRALTQPPE